LQKYWKQIEEENDDARKENRRIEKERKRLELGINPHFEFVVFISILLFCSTR
jgi:hypothetical protein